MLLKHIKQTALAAVLTCSTIAAPVYADQRLTMGATYSASSFYAYQVGITNFLNEAIEGINIKVRELGGAEVSTEALLRGEIDFGIAVTSSDYAALQGAEPYGKPATNLRTLYFFAPLPLNFVVAAGSDITTVSGLAGQAFNPGGRGSSTERQVELVLAAIDVKPDLVRSDGSDALEAFQNGKIEGFVKGGNHPDGYILQAAASRDIRFLSLSSEQSAKVTAAHPFFSAVVTAPGTLYGGDAGEISTVQTVIGVNTTAALDEEIAYKIAKAIFSKAGTTAASEVYAPAGSIDAAQLTIDAAVAPLHPGVVRYLQEAGYTVPDHLNPTN